jgi:hypothetical protein
MSARLYSQWREQRKRHFAGVGLEPEPVMSAGDIARQAGGIWADHVAAVQKREGCTRSRAIDIALRDPAGRRAFNLVRDAGILQKLGGGDWPGGPSHGVSQSADPHDSTRHRESGDEALARYRSSHANKSLAQFNAHVDGLMSADKTLTRSRAMDRAAREQPALWAAAMGKASPSESDVHVPSNVNNPAVISGPGRSPTMPPSDDANSGTARGPYQSPYGGGRPYP